MLTPHSFLPPDELVIRPLPDCAYLSGIEELRASSQGLTHVGLIHTPHKTTIQAIIKCFPRANRNRGLANEIAGYLAARHNGLPVASGAYLMVIDKRRLIEVHPESERILADEEDEIPVWATEAIPGAPVRALYKLGHPRTQQRLKQWRFMPRLLAYDDLVANVDRNQDNLIQVNNNKEFVLIDHGEICGSIEWLPELLDFDGEYRNILIDELFEGQLPSDVASAMIHEASYHEAIIQALQPELRFWLVQIYGVQSSIPRSLERFLVARSQNSVERIRKRARMLV